MNVHLKIEHNTDIDKWIAQNKHNLNCQLAKECDYEKKGKNE